MYIGDTNDKLPANMSAVDADYEVTICANCGKGEEESIKLKACTACKMVKYCSRDCQIAHRPQHKKECKRRAAKLHDEKLFKQPPPLFGDCPICFVRLPTFDSGRKYMACCGKEICSGCVHTPQYDDQGNEVDNQKCSFCRTPFPSTEEAAAKTLNKRAEEYGDARAMYKIALQYKKGSNECPQDYTKALELYHRTVELGFACGPYHNIGYAYYLGLGVEVDKKKATHYWELAAVAGSVQSRYNLGSMEVIVGNFDRALKHYMIAAKDGSSDAVGGIKDLYSNEFATKDDYTKALHAYQVYLGEIKSDQRDKAAAADEEYRYY